MLVLVRIHSTIADLTPDEASKKSEAEIKQHRQKQEVERESLRKVTGVPLDWEDIAKTPLKLTIPAGGGKFTIDVADKKYVTVHGFLCQKMPCFCVIFDVFIEFITKICNTFDKMTHKTP